MGPTEGGAGSTAEVRTRAQFAQQLTLVREKAGLSIREVAAATGVQASTIGGYFSGRHLPGSGQTRVLVRILEACGITDQDEVDRWTDAVGRVRRSPGPRPADAPTPFRGLQCYETGDRDWFFGRDALTRTLANLVQQRTGGGVFFVVGPSGSGKSSVLRAGLLATLAAETPDRPALLVTPGTEPHLALAAVLAGPLAADADTLAAELLRRPGRLIERVHTALPDRSPVVVIDQFEEMFARGVRAEGRDALLAVLQQAATEPGPGIAFVLGMRADFYSHAAQRPELVTALQTAQTVVGPMTESQLREVITKPAERAQLDIEDGLVDLILRDMAPAGPRDPAHDPGALPLLSHALLTAWQRGQRRRLTIADYRGGGGIRDAVAQTAEEVWNGLDATQQWLTRSLFVRLVDTTDAVTATRRTVAHADLRTGVEANDLARETVLRRFVDSRHITSDARNVRLTHEALLYAWPRLQEWIESDRAGLRLHRYLGEASRTWHEADRDPDSLLRGVRLEAARDWAADPAHATELNLVERAFLDASTRLEQQERLAARRHTRHLTRLLAATVALLLLAFASTAFALVQRTHARQQQRIAEAVRDTAVSRQVAGEADLLRVNDPALADQLALAAYQVSPTPEARSSLLAATALPPVTRFRTSAGTMAAAIAPAGDLLATGDNLGSVHLWKLDRSGTPTSLGAPSRAVPGSAFAAAISPDAHLLAVGGAADTVTLWQIADPAHPRLAARLTLPGPTVYGVAFSPDGTTLAIAMGGRGIALVDLTDPAHPKSLPPPPDNPSGDVHALAFSADGLFFAAGTPDHTVRVWHAEHPQRMTPDGADLPGPGAAVDAVTIGARPDDIAAAAADRTVYLWRADPHHGWSPQPAKLRGCTSFANAVAFGPDGLTLAAGCADGAADLWRRSDLVQIQHLGHPAPVTGVLFLPDSSLLTAAADGYARVWSLPGGIIRDATNQVFTVAFGRNGTLEANAESTASTPGEVELWNPADHRTTQGPGPTIASPTGPGRFSGSSAISHSGGLLAIGASDGGTTLWDVSRPSHPVRVGPVLRGPTMQLEALAFSPDDRTLAVAGDDHSVWTWNVSRPVTPLPLAHLDQATNFVFNLAFSPNGRYLAAACADGRLYLWDITGPTGPVLVSTTAVSRTYAYALGFDPAGTTIAVGGADKTVRLLDVTDPAHPRFAGAPLTGPTNYVYSVAFDPDGSTLAAGSTDGSVWLWSLNDRQKPALYATLRASAPVFTISYNQDGAILAAGASDDTVWLWHIRTPTAQTIVCRDTVGAITPAEWQEYLSGTPYRNPCSS